jgi:hypothetical protein
VGNYPFCIAFDRGKGERTVQEIWLGLSSDELLEVYNDSVDHFSEGRQKEVRARASEWTKLPVFPADMPVDLAVMVQFIVNAIRLNNRRIQEQLRVKPASEPDPPSG